MNRILLSLGILLTIALSSCDSNEHNTDTTSDKITLNDGKLWLVNEEMKPHIHLSEDLLKVYLEDGDSDYKGLAERLEHQNKELISSCTMKGEAHEQLHHWLHPHLALTSDLMEAESDEEAEKTIAELKASFELYHQYFE